MRDCLDSRVVHNELENLVSRDDENLVPVVNDHVERRSVYRKGIEVSAVWLKDKNAARVGNVDAALIIHGYRIRLAELSGLIAAASEFILVLAIGCELVDRWAESTAYRENISQAIDGKLCIEFRIVG